MKLRIVLIVLSLFVSSLSYAATGAGIGAINRGQLIYQIKSDAVSRIDTIAALRFVAGVRSGQLVQVAGYYAAGDGGGGPGHRWDAASVCTDDGIVCIDPVAPGAGRWLLQYHESLDIKWGGLKGDGVTDNLAQLKKVVALALANNLEIIVPPGVFYSHVTEATGPISLDLPGVDTALKIRGYNPKTCILKFGPNDPRNAVNNISVKVFYSNRSTSTDAGVNTTATFVKLQDVTFQGPDTAGPDMLADYNWVTAASPDYYQKRLVDCFYLSGGDDGGVIAQNVHFTGRWANNVVSTGALKNNNSFVRSHFNSYEGSLLLFTSNNTVTVDDCDFDRSGTRRAVMLVDRGDSYGHGVYFRVDTTFTIKNSRFWDVASSAVNMSSGSALLSEPYFNGKTQYQILSGSYFSPLSERIAYTGFYYPFFLIENCRFDGVSSYGITANTGVTVRNCIFGRNYSYALHYAEWAAKDKKVFIRSENNIYMSSYGIYTQTDGDAIPLVVFISSGDIYNTINTALRIAQWNDECVIDRAKFLAVPIDGYGTTWNTVTTTWGNKPFVAFELLSAGGFKTIKITNSEFIGEYYQPGMASNAYGTFILINCTLDSSQRLRSASGATSPIELFDTAFAGTHDRFSAIYDRLRLNRAVSPTPIALGGLLHHGLGTSFLYNEYSITGTGTIASLYIGRTANLEATQTNKYSMYGEIILHLQNEVTFTNGYNIRTVTGADVTRPAGSTVKLFCRDGVWTLL